MKAIRQINIDKLELEYTIPTNRLTTIEHGFSSEFITAERSSPRPINKDKVKYYRHTLAIYYNTPHSLFNEKRVFLGKLYWGNHPHRHGIYFQADNAVLYDRRFNDYLKDVDNAIKSLGGMLVRICKIEIAYDITVNLVGKFIELLARGEILGSKISYYKWNNQPRSILKAINDNTLYYFPKDNPETIYINGKQRTNDNNRKYSRMVCRIYNKSVEVACNNNKKAYILERFKQGRKKVYRFEVGIYNPKIINELLKEVLYNDYYEHNSANHNREAVRSNFCSQLEFITDENHIRALVLLASLKLFTVCVKINHERLFYSFIDLIDRGLLSFS